MNFDQIIEAVEAASVQKTVKVPSTDYYSRAGDTEDETIRFIDPDLFVNALQIAQQLEQEIKDEKRHV